MLTKIKNVENIQQQITNFIRVKSSFGHEIVRLQSAVDELKQEIKLKRSFNKYLDKELKTVKSEIVKEKEKLE